MPARSAHYLLCGAREQEPIDRLRLQLHVAVCGWSRRGVSARFDADRGGRLARRAGLRQRHQATARAPCGLIEISLRRPGQARVVNSALAGPRSRACGAQKHLVASAAPPLPPSAPRHLRLQLLPVARSRGRGELLAREHACSSPACAQKENHAGRLRPKDTTRVRQRRNGDVPARASPGGER